jgi:GPH family glycoside/pentoside/hexuronide:cation symporter
MGVHNFMGQIAWLIAPWFLWFMKSEQFEGDMLAGAGTLAIMIGSFTVIVGVLPAVFLRERSQNSPLDLPKTNQVESAPKSQQTKSLKENIIDFLQGFAITIKFKPFLQLCAATFLVFNGFMMVSSFQSYVIIYYVFAGDQTLGAEYIGWSGMVSAIATFCVILFVTKLSVKIGKRRAFFFTTGVSIFGFALKWFLYTPQYPMLLLIPSAFIAFGLGGLFTLMGSMVADVCDVDELQTHERREGLYGSIFWWVVKLGMAVALAAGGYLLNATGFDVALNGAQTADTILLMRIFDISVPVICSSIAIWMIYSYPITEDKANEVRQQLEQRRGKMN